MMHYFRQHTPSSEIDVDDSLDAYLRALGQPSPSSPPPIENQEKRHTFSFFPTVPPRDALYTNKRMLVGIARKLSDMNSYASGCGQVPVATVVRYLEMTQLSLECIALAYNILANYSPPDQPAKRQDSAVTMLIDLAMGKHHKPTETGPELLLVTALRMATSFWDQRKTPVSWWTETVLQSAYGEEEVVALSSDMFSSIGWKLPIFAAPDAIGRALAALPVHDLPKGVVMNRPDRNNKTFEFDYPDSSGRRKSSVIDPISPFTVATRSSDRSNIEHFDVNTAPRAKSYVV